MENLFWLVLLIIYLILQFVGSKKKPEPGRDAPPGRPHGAERYPQGSAGNSLEDALREIREALGAEPERPQPAERAKVDSPLPSVSPSAPTRLERRLPDEPRRTQQGEGRPSGPGRRKRGEFAGEEAFEHRPTLESPPAARTIPDSTRTRRPADAKPKRPASLSSGRRETLLGSLHDPQSVQDAVILSEVLGPPRSRRQGR